MANDKAALSHFEGALAELRNSSAAGYPESYVAKCIEKIEMGIGELKGAPVAAKPEVTSANQFPPTKNRGDVAVPSKPVSGPSKAFTAEYADGFKVQKDDRSKFPDKSPSGAKRLSITKN